MESEISRQKGFLNSEMKMAAKKNLSSEKRKEIRDKYNQRISKLRKDLSEYRKATSVNL
jgi:nickel-dependent lactate racemase